MAVTATLVSATPEELIYLLDHDGAAGNALVIDNATLAADVATAAAAGQTSGPALATVNGLAQDTAENPNTQAIARRDMLGDGVDQNRPYCECRINNRTGIIVWAVDADVDAVSTRRHELNINSNGAAVADEGRAYLHVQFRHTLTR